MKTNEDFELWYAFYEDLPENDKEYPDPTCIKDAMQQAWEAGQKELKTGAALRTTSDYATALSTFEEFASECPQGNFAGWYYWLKQRLNAAKKETLE